MDEIIEKTTSYLNIIFSQIFTKLIVAVIILLIGFVMGRIAGRLVQKVLHEIELNNILKKAGVKLELEEGLSKFTIYFIYFITIIWALDSLGLTTTMLNMISAAVLVVIIISVLFGIKDFIPNIISGFFIYRKSVIKSGDRVRIGNISGIVKKVSLMETEIKTSSGDMMHVPNSVIMKKEFLIKKK